MTLAPSQNTTFLAENPYRFDGFARPQLPVNENPALITFKVIFISVPCCPGVFVRRDDVDHETIWRATVAGTGKHDPTSTWYDRVRSEPHLPRYVQSVIGIACKEGRRAALEAASRFEDLSMAGSEGLISLSQYSAVRNCSG